MPRDATSRSSPGTFPDPRGQGETRVSLRPVRLSPTALTQSVSAEPTRPHSPSRVARRRVAAAKPPDPLDPIIGSLGAKRRRSLHSYRVQARASALALFDAITFRRIERRPTQVPSPSNVPVSP